MYDDEQLKHDVEEELLWEPRVDSAQIGVTAKAGVITLSGHVESFVEKHAAEMATNRVKGVKAVAEEISVRLPVHIKRGDDEIAAAAIGRLAWDIEIPKDAIKVTVEKGWVTLTGEVGWHYQKYAAENDVRGLSGVVGVSNQATIKPHLDVSNIGNHITQALHRSWFDTKTIRVDADGGTVHLRGTARSWHDRDVAVLTAWSAPGVTFVTNDIVVT